MSDGEAEVLREITTLHPCIPASSSQTTGRRVRRGRDWEGRSSYNEYYCW